MPELKIPMCYAEKLKLQPVAGRKPPRGSNGRGYAVTSVVWYQCGGVDLRGIGSKEKRFLKKILSVYLSIHLSIYCCSDHLGFLEEALGPVLGSAGEWAALEEWGGLRVLTEARVGRKRSQEKRCLAGGVSPL